MSSKGNPLLSVRIPEDLASLVDEKAETLNMSKSQVVLLALKNLLQPPDPMDELSEVKRDVAALKVAMARISPDLPLRRS
jgi:hypothetical protein